MDRTAVAEFVRLLLKTCGEIELNNAVSQLSPWSREFIKSVGPQRFVQRLPQLFTTKRDSKQKLIVKLDLCLEFCPDGEGKGGCCLNKCNSLHLCRFFIKGTCKYGFKCRGSHDICDHHTRRVLTGLHLDFLLDSPDLLLDVLKIAVDASEIQRAATRREVPDVCKFYNKAPECKKGENCPCLHVCEHFVDGDCKFGGRCKRQHDFKDSHNRKVLEEYNLGGVNNEVVRRLLKGRERKRTVSSGSAIDVPGKDPIPSMPPNERQETDQKSVKTEIGKDTEICGFHLRSKCNYKNHCIHRHTELPYLWEYAMEGDAEWKSFSSDLNLILEDAFCNVDNEDAVVPIQETMYCIRFQNMSAVPANNISAKTVRIQRLSTVSSVTAPAGHVFSTRWQWYWKDENGKWQSYDTPDDEVATNTTSSQCLERDFLSGKESHSFSASHHHYTLYFKKWYQQNDKHKTRRPVRRRPELVSKHNMKDIEKRRRATASTCTAGFSAVPAESDILPPHWTPIPPDEDYKCVPLQSISEEYKKTEKMFLETLDGEHRIIKIERIQNPDLWTLFTQRKLRMSKKAGKEPEERQLFHGTSSDLVQAICQQGFDWRLCGKHGTSYGKGSYFACRANYSHRYTNRKTYGGQNQMFLAKVLVGAFTVGNQSLHRPPPKNPFNPNVLFDSCCDNSANPALFVIFENGQSYPEFLITYV